MGSSSLSSLCLLSPTLLSQLRVELGVEHGQDLAVEDVAVGSCPAGLPAFLDSLAVLRLRREPIPG